MRALEVASHEAGLIDDVVGRARVDRGLLGGMDERLSAHRLKALPAKVMMHTRWQLLMSSFALDEHQDAAPVALGAHHFTGSLAIIKSSTEVAFAG